MSQDTVREEFQLPAPSVTYADHSYPAYSAKQMQAAYAAGLAARVPDGWKIVPIEPSIEMREALQHHVPSLSFLKTRMICIAMLSAAPKEQK